MSDSQDPKYYLNSPTLDVARDNLREQLVSRGMNETVIQGIMVNMSTIYVSESNTGQEVRVQTTGATHEEAQTLADNRAQELLEEGPSHESSAGGSY